MTAATPFLEAMLVVVLCLPLLRIPLSRERFDLLTPPLVFSVLMFFCYVYPIDGFIAGTDDFSTSWDSDPAARPTPSGLDTAILVATVAAVCFFAGYYLLRPKLPESGTIEPSTVSRADPARLFLVGSLFTIVGVFLFSIGVYFIGGLGVLLSSLGDRLRTFAGLNYFIGAIGLPLCVSIIWFCDLIGQGKRSSASFIAFTFLALLANSLEGSKSVIFVFIVTLAIIYHVLYRRISTLTIVLGASTLFVILTAYALFAREYLAVGQFTTIDPQHFAEKDASNALTRELDGNFIQLQVLTTLIDRMPAQLAFQHGRTYLSLLTMPIPRGFWPNKPLPSTGVIALAFWPERWLDWGTTMPPGLVGEMYLNFGIPGVGFGMFAFGRLYSHAHALISRPRPNIQLITAYALLVALLPHYLRGEFVAPTVLLLMWGIPSLLAERYIFYQAPSPTPT